MQELQEAIDVYGYKYTVFPVNHTILSKNREENGDAQTNPVRLSYISIHSNSGHYVFSKTFSATFIIPEKRTYKPPASRICPRTGLQEKQPSAFAFGIPQAIDPNVFAK
jgi:hypothetical protein